MEKYPILFGENSENPATVETVEIVNKEKFFAMTYFSQARD